jgi:hypothetical protein
MDDDRMTLKDIIALFAFLGVGLGLLMMVGTCGAVDQDKITLGESVGKLLKWLAVFSVSAVILVRILKEEDE